MTTRVFILLITGLLSGPVFGEEIVFEMSVFGIRFGTMTVTRNIEHDGTEVFTLIAKGKTDFLWMKREEESKYVVKYKHGVLHTSDYVYLNKGQLEKWSKVSRANGHYTIETHNGSRQLNESIEYSLLKLYFDPDRKVNRVFCEEECSFSTLNRDAKSGAMLVTCHNGSKSTYHLIKGRVVGLDIHLPIATVQMKRVN